MSRPVVFRPGAVCPEGYLCIPGMEPIKLPDVQPDVEPTGPWWQDLVTEEGGGSKPSSFYSGWTDEGDYIHNLPYVITENSGTGGLGYFATNFEEQGWPWPERIIPDPDAGPPGYGYPVLGENIVGPYILKDLLGDSS